MGKKARERKHNFEIRDMRKYVRLFDYVSKSNVFKVIDQFVGLGKNTNAVVIDATQIHSYIEANDMLYEHPQLWAMDSDDIDGGDCFRMGVVRPPFDHCFVEYTNLYHGNGWMVEPMSGFPNMHGCLCSYDSEENKLTLFPFYKYRDIEEPFAANAPFTILLNDRGQIAHEADVDFQRPLKSNGDDGLADYRDVMEYARSSVGITLAAFTFLNCKNITLVDKEPNLRANTIFERETGIPMVKYKTLSIRPAGSRSDSDNDTREYQGVMPLHLRRGHFKTFTEDNPRFGRNHPNNIGTFWVNAAAVGERKNGIVIKEYEVSA